MKVLYIKLSIGHILLTYLGKWEEWKDVGIFLASTALYQTFQNIPFNCNLKYWPNCTLWFFFPYWLCNMMVFVELSLENCQLEEQFKEITHDKQHTIDRRLTMDSKYVWRCIHIQIKGRNIFKHYARTWRRQYMFVDSGLVKTCDVPLLMRLLSVRYRTIFNKFNSFSIN